MRPRPRRQRRNANDPERIIELLEKAHARGDLDPEHIARLKKLAAQLPATSGNERLWLRLAKATKTELYDVGTTLLAKIIRGEIPS